MVKEEEAVSIKRRPRLWGYLGPGLSTSEMTVIGGHVKYAFKSHHPAF